MLTRHKCAVAFIIFVVTGVALAGEQASKEAVYYYNEGVDRQQKGDYSEAMSFYNKTMLLNPDFEYLRYIQNNVGVIYARIKDAETAEKFFNEAIATDKNYRAPGLNLGLVYDMQDDKLKATEYWMRLFDIDIDQRKPKDLVMFDNSGFKEKEFIFAAPQNTLSQKIILNVAGIIAAQAGDWKTAEEKLNAALKTDSKYRAAQLNLGLVYEKQQKLLEGPRYQECMQATEYWMKLFNIDLEKLKPKSFTLLDGSELKNRCSLLVEPNNPASEKIFLNIAGIIAAQGEDLKAAEEKFNQVLKIDPAFRPAQLNLGLIYDKQGNRLKSLLFWLKTFDIKLEEEKPGDFISEGIIRT